MSSEAPKKTSQRLAKVDLVSPAKRELGPEEDTDFDRPIVREEVVSHALERRARAEQDEGPTDPGVTVPAEVDPRNHENDDD